MQKPSFQTFLLGGLLPVIAFTIVEAYYGTIGGLIAGITFGLGETLWEYLRLKRVQKITIFSNALVVILGGLSLLENDGRFFKLQPAILLAVFGALLIGSSLLKTPFMVALAKKQNPNLPEVGIQRLTGLNLRLGFLMLVLAGVGVHAAYYWSTALWATFKSIGAPVAMAIYVGLEILVIRFQVKRTQATNQQSPPR